MFAHLPGVTPSARCLGNHIAAVAYMRAAPGVVRTEVVGADRRAIGLGDKSLTIGACPISERIFAANVAIDCIGLAARGSPAE